MADPQVPLREYLKVQAVTDAELRGILQQASKDAARTIRKADRSGIRAAQQSLAKQQMDLWLSTRDHVMVGIGDAVDAAAETQALFDEELYRRAGINTLNWRMSMLAQARAGIENLRSRQINGKSLSDRVYRYGALSSGKINRLINEGIALGNSAREIAKSVERFIDPNVPGGVSSAAMRLGRTELNNAFHTTSVRQYQDSPFVEGVHWYLSGSHPRPDECNQYADSSHYRGGPPGVFKPDDVPGKPHPNCLCYTTPETISEEQFLKGLHSGKYDNHINDVMGCRYGA